jgi:hypothetical protein
MHWLGRLLEASIPLARKHLQGTKHTPTLFKLCLAYSRLTDLGQKTPQNFRLVE